MKKHFITTILSLSVVLSFVYYVSLNECTKNEENAPADLPQGINKMVTYFGERFGEDYSDEAYLNIVKQANALKAQSNKVANSYLEWEELGPNNVGGRTRGIVVDRNNSNIVYAAAVTGGLYISRNGGDLWEEYAHNDTLETYAIGQIRQAADGTIYFSTGEPDHGFGTNTRGAFSPSFGIYKLTGPDDVATILTSTDQTVANPATEFSRINKIELHPTDANTIFVATNTGVRRSVDGGLTWDIPMFTPSANSEAHDIRIGRNPAEASSSSLVYATVGSHTYKSTDGGNSFASIGNAVSCVNPNETVSLSGGDRKEIAISPSNHLVAYVSIVSGGGQLQRIVQTIDGGICWRIIGTFDENFLHPYTSGDNSQGWYDNCIAVDPADPNRIYVGGITLWTWSNSNGWAEINTNNNNGAINPFYVHSDIHVFEFDPNDPSTLFIGCDGGVFRTFNAEDIQPSFIPRNKNYNATQFYTVAADFKGRVVGGTQDNSCPYVDYEGLTAQEGKVLNGGDGAYTEISDIDTDIMFLSSQNANNSRSSNRGESTSSFISTADETTYLANALFIAPFHLYEDLPRWKELSEITELNELKSWSINGTDTVKTTVHTINPAKTPDLVQLEINAGKFVAPNGETVILEMTDAMRMDSITAEKGARFFSGSNRLFLMDNPLELSAIGATRAIGTFSGGVLSGLGTSKDGDVMWAGSTAGSLLRVRGLNDLSNYTTDNDGTLRYNSSQISSYPTGSLPWSSGFITSVNTNPNNIQQVIVSFANFSGLDKVYFTDNALASNPTWTSIQFDLPEEMPVYEVIFDATTYGNATRVYAATELGVWAMVLDEQAWVEENDALGRCRVVRIRQEPMNDISCPVIYLGTFGRGLWRSVKSLNNATYSFCDTELPRNTVGIDDNILNSSNDLELTLAPNPMVNYSKLSFKLADGANTFVSIFSLNGQVVQDYNLGNLNAGNHIIDLQRDDLITGNYIVMVNANGKTKSTKLVIN